MELVYSNHPVIHHRHSDTGNSTSKYSASKKYAKALAFRNEQEVS